MRRATTAGRPVPPPTHYQQAKTELARLLERLGRRGVGRLPAEDQLSKDLGFSRPTIRSALLALQMEGKVRRLHGVGTLINRHALDVAANLAEDRAFVDVLADLGYEPSIEIAGMEQQPLPARAAERLGCSPGEPACVITRVFRASGTPAVLSRDYVVRRLLPGPPGGLDPERSTFAFLERWAGRTVRYSVAGIRPVNPGPPVTSLLGLDDGEALLLLDHLHVDTADQPVGVTESYVSDRYIRFAIVRTAGDV